MAQAEKKSVGVKVTPTIPQDIFEKLEADAELNGMKAATRIGQIVSLFYNGKLALVDVAGVQNVIVSAPTTTVLGDQSENKSSVKESKKESKLESSIADKSDENNGLQALAQEGQEVEIEFEC